MIRERYLSGRVAAGIAALVALGVGPLPALEGENVQWKQIDQLCGYVESVVPIKKVIQRANGKGETLLYTRPFKATRVVLYKAGGQKPVCCEAAQKIGEEVTDQNGHFSFADYASGRYWLVIHLKSGDVSLPVEVDHYDKRLCEAPNMDRVIFADATPTPKIEVHII